MKPNNETINVNNLNPAVVATAKGFGQLVAACGGNPTEIARQINRIFQDVHREVDHKPTMTRFNEFCAAACQDPVQINRFLWLETTAKVCKGNRTEIVRRIDNAYNVSYNCTVSPRKKQAALERRNSLLEMLENYNAEQFLPDKSTQ
jgi:hypothetical protein